MQQMYISYYSGKWFRELDIMELLHTKKLDCEPCEYIWMHDGTGGRCGQCEFIWMNKLLSDVLDLL